MQAIQIQDFTNYRFLSDLKLSPQGTRAALAVHQADLEKNGYRTVLWVWEATDGRLWQLTAGGDEGLFCWLDEEQLLFASRRGQRELRPGEAETDFYRISLSGGEAQKAFTVPAAVRQIRPLPDGRFVVKTVFDNNAPCLEGLDDAARKAALDAFEEEQDYFIIDELPFWKNGQGRTNKKRSRLNLFDPKTGSLSPITGPLTQVDEWALDDEKARIAYVCSTYDDVEPERPALHLYDLASGQDRCLVPLGELSYDSLGFDGADILLTGSRCQRYGLNENPVFWRVTTADGTLTQVSCEDLSCHSSVGSDNRYGGGSSYAIADGGAYFTITDRFCSRICHMSREGVFRPVSQAEGSVDGFDVKNGRCLMVAMRGNQLQELYELDLATGQERQLSHFNQAVLEDKFVSQPKYLPFTNSDGVEIDGWVLEPMGFDPSGSYPAILDIHGGPKTVYGTVFFHEMQVWASKGYLVLFCNPRGGDGRGNEFMDIRGRYGQEDYRDIMEFVDHVLAQYPQIDKARLGVTGGSYGGFMTNWIIGHTDRFAAAASQRSIANWVTMEGTCDIGPNFDKDQTAATPWTDIQKEWDQSPLQFADRCKTPTLFIHSDEDYRCWMVEALQMFSALRMHGVEARICLFHGENHELSRSGKPRHRIRRLEEITTWFEDRLKSKAQ